MFGIFGSFHGSLDGFFWSSGGSFLPALDVLTVGGSATFLLLAAFVLASSVVGVVKVFVSAVIPAVFKGESLHVSFSMVPLTSRGAASQCNCAAKFTPC